MPTPNRRPGLHTTAGDHEERIRRLERNAPKVAPYDPPWFYIVNGCGTIDQHEFGRIDWAVYEGEECTWEEYWELPVQGGGAFMTNRPDVFSFDWINPDHRQYVRYHSEGMYYIYALLGSPNFEELTTDLLPYFILAHGGHARRFGASPFVTRGYLPFSRTWGRDEDPRVIMDFGTFLTAGEGTEAEPGLYGAHSFQLHYGFDEAAGTGLNEVQVGMFGYRIAPVIYDYDSYETIIPPLS